MADTSSPDAFTPTDTAVVSGPGSVNMSPRPAMSDFSSPPVTATEPTVSKVAQSSPIVDTEPPKDVPKDTPKETTPAPGPDDWAQRFEKLTQRDSEVRERESRLKDAEADVMRARELLAMAKEKPLDALKTIGLSVDDILKSHLNNGKPDPMDKIAELEARYAKLEEELSGHKNIKAEYEKYHVSNWDSQFESLLQQPEYAIVKDWEGAVEAVAHRVSQHYKKTGELLQPKSELDKMSTELRSRLEKLRGYIKPTEQEPAKANTPAQPNTKTSTGPKQLPPNVGTTPPRYRSLDDDEAEMARISAKYS